MKKRLIAFLLVLIMVLGMLPVSAFAADGDATKYTYTLVYKWNDGTDRTWNTDDTSPTAETSFTHYVNTATLPRNGYQHSGWADEANATTARYTGGEPIVLNKDNPTKTIYAIWLPIFELHYNANGGTGAPDSQTYTSYSATSTQATFTSRNQIPTKDGYTFKGWADSAAATTAQYQPGGTIAVKHENSPKTVYAVWEKNDSPVPDNPGGTKPDVANAQVKICVQCIEDSATHQPKNYGILAGAYVDGLLQVDGTYYYSITLNRAKYIEKFDQDSGKTHTDTEPNESIEFKWQWKNGKWELISDIAPVIKVKCDTTTKPSKPALNEGSPVLVQCVQAGTHTDSGKDSAKKYFALGGYAYRYEEVKKEGSNVWKDEADNKWTYQLKLKRDEFVKAYNNLSLVTTHTDTNPGEETYVTWKHDGTSWKLVPAAGQTSAGIGAVINVKCTPVPTSDEPTLANTDLNLIVKCVTNNAAHSERSMPLKAGTFKMIGTVQDRGPLKFCTIEVETAQYVAEFDTDRADTHTAAKTIRVELYLKKNDSTAKWTNNKSATDNVIEVTCEPKAPTADELKKLEMAVQVKCVVDASQQHTAAYGLLGECDVDYFVFEPRQEGDDWLCDISYYPERYVAEFNTTFQNLKHVQNDEKIVPVTLIWAGGSWQIKTQGRVHVTEEYTVTYTDGVDGEEVFADQVYSDLRKDSTTPAFNGTPTRTGYTFAGWEPEVAATVTQTVTYVAKWEAKKANVHLMIFKSGDLSKPIVDVPYAADKLAGDTIDLTKIDPSSYLDFDFEIDGGWYDDGMFNSYKRYLDGLQDKPAGLEKLLITGNWQNLKLIVTELVPVVYFDSLESLTAYQNDHSKTEGILHTTKARLGSALPTADAPTATRDGYTFTYWSREGQTGDVTGQTINGWTNLYANWKVTLHNIYAYARLNSYFAPLTNVELYEYVKLNAATLERLGLGSYNANDFISIGKFSFKQLPLTEDMYFGDDAELDAVAAELAKSIALETGVSKETAEKIAWTVLYKTENEEDMAPGYPAEDGYQLSGNLNLATVMFEANGENVTGMPAVNYTYDEVAKIHDFYFAGDTFTMPADPTREGYIFEGWSVKVLPDENDADHLDADGADDAADETLLKAGDTYTITAGGVVFTAQWEARTDTPYTVEHYLENLDGSYALDTTEPLKGTTDTTVTAAAKSYDNFTYDSTVPGTVASGNIAGDGSLVLKLFYTRNTYDYTVRHIKQLPDGTYDEANAEVETLSGKFEALAAVTAKDYGSHYPTNDAGTKQNIKIEKNLTIDVKYDLDNHTLTFETNGGSAINPVTVRHGNAVARPADPTKDKYTFIGWYADPEFTEEYDFATVLEADKTIYAKFELTSTPIGDIYVRYDVLHIKQLPDGTYDLANAEVEHLSAKKDTTVTAVIKDYRATHHVNVNRTLSKLTGTAIQPYMGVDGKPVYTILSVYYDLDFHTLTFDTMGGSKIAPETVRHGLTVAKPKDPVNGGYIFDGWYTDKTFRHRYDFSTPLTEDITIYAKWFLIVLPGVTVKKNTPKLNTADHFAYVQGYPDGTVKPAGNITRAETAAILFRLMDDASRKTYYSTKSGFRDVASGSWYNTYVATLNNAGVITDSSNGYFRPNEAITRAELAAMLAKFSETTSAANYFNDVSAKYWAANAIAICAKLGWITGYPDGTFRPDRNVTRAELMAMINRATGRAPKSADAFLPGMKTWIDNTSDKWYYLDVQEATNSHSYTVKGSETWTALTSDPNWSLYE